MSRFVIDASIALTWCFPDENAALAEHIADRFKQGDTALAPSFWPHEVLNALLVGEKRKRISKVQVQEFLYSVSQLQITLQPALPKEVFIRIQVLSREHQLTAYDAAYLDLALVSNLPLATLDEDLLRACKNSGTAIMQR